MSFVPNIGDKYKTTFTHTIWSNTFERGSIVTVVNSNSSGTQIQNADGARGWVLTSRLDPSSIAPVFEKIEDEPKLPIIVRVNARDDEKGAPLVKVENECVYTRVSLRNPYSEGEWGGPTILNRKEVCALISALTIAVEAHEAAHQAKLDAALKELTDKYHADVQALKDRYNA